MPYLSSDQFSCSVVSDSLRPHELQHAKPACPSSTPGVYSNAYPLSWWCHPAISSSVVPFSCPQSLPASESFPMSLLFRWGGQSIEVSASASVLPMNTQGLISFRMDWLALQSKGLSRVFSNTIQKHQFFCAQLSSQSNSHILTWPYIHVYGKTTALTTKIFVGKVISLFFNMLSRFVITFLPRSKRLLISWLQSPSAVILEPPKIKTDTVSTVSPSISHEVMGPDAMILVFWMLSFKPTFSLSSFTFNHGILQVRILEWVAFPFSSDLPNPGIKPRSPKLQADFLPAKPPGKPLS